MFDHAETRSQTSDQAIPEAEPEAAALRAYHEAVAERCAPYDAYARQPRECGQLFRCAERDSPVGMRRAIEAGASVNARDGDDQSAINAAAAGGYPESVKWLLARGADPFPRVQSARLVKSSPLVSAVFNGSPRCLEILLAQPDNVRNGVASGDKSRHLVAALERAAHGSNWQALAALRRAAPITAYLEACENMLEGATLPPNAGLDALLSALPDSPRSRSIWSIAFERLNDANAAGADAPDEPQSPAEALPQTFALHERAILAEAMASVSPVAAPVPSQNRVSEAQGATLAQPPVGAQRPSRPTARAGRRL